MPDPFQQRTIEGVCPNCGPTQIDVVLQGSSYFSGISTPNWSCMVWVGWCRKCRSCVEADFDDGADIETLEWEAVDEEKSEFLFGDCSPIRTDPRTDPS